MNIFGVLLFTGIVLLGYICGKALGTHFGISGWIGGFVLGCSLGVIAHYVLLRLIDIWHRWRPLRPPCKEGKYSSDNYRPMISADGKNVFRCRCDTDYIRTRNRFDEILEDGSIRPYMKRNWMLGKWQEYRGEIKGGEGNWKN